MAEIQTSITANFFCFVIVGLDQLPMAQSRFMCSQVDFVVLWLQYQSQLFLILTILSLTLDVVFVRAILSHQDCILASLACIY